MPIRDVSQTKITLADRDVIREGMPSGATYYIKGFGTWVHYLRYRAAKGLGAWVVYEYNQKWSVSYSHLHSLGKLHSIYPDSELWGY